MFYESDLNFDSLDRDSGRQCSREDQSPVQSDASRPQWTSSGDNAHDSSITVDHVIDNTCFVKTESRRFVFTNMYFV